jgi:hypothetical protein
MTSRRFKVASAKMERVVIAVLALAVVSGLEAELIVFTDGRVVKAAGHEIAGSQLEIRLSGGGSYSVARERVERIVDDEVAASALPPPPAAPPMERAASSSPRVGPAPPPQPAIATAPVAAPTDAPRPRPNTAWNRRHRAVTTADGQNPGMDGSPDGFGRQ